MPTARDLDPSLALSQRRYIELVRLLYEDGWTQTRIAHALGISQSYVSQILKGRGPAITVRRIEAAISGLPISEEYFYDPDINSGDYTRYMGKRPRRTQSAVVPAPDDTVPEGWRKFLDLGLDRVYRQRGLSPEDLEYVRNAPGRKGLKTLDFYVDICNAVLRGTTPHPDFEELPDEEAPEARQLVRRREVDEDDEDDEDGNDAS